MIAANQANIGISGYIKLWFLRLKIGISRFHEVLNLVRPLNPCTVNLFTQIITPKRSLQFFRNLRNLTKRISKYDISQHISDGNENFQIFIISVEFPRL